MELNEMLDAFERGNNALKSAGKFEKLDLLITANRIYIAGENLAYSLLLATSGSAPRDHGRIWDGVQKLYERGVLKADYKPLLETSYRLRMKGDYGRDIRGVTIISKETVRNQIKSLREFAEEVERILKEKRITRKVKNKKEI